MPGTYLLPKDTLSENWAIGEAPDRYTKFIIVAITSSMENKAHMHRPAHLCSGRWDGSCPSKEHSVI